MKTQHFKRLVDRCEEAYGDLSNAYVCLSWREDEYHPIFTLDVNAFGGAVVAATEKLNFFEWFGPKPCYVSSGAYHEDKIIGHTIKFQELASWKDHFVDDCELEFVIATTNNGFPQNIVGTINPHRTYKLVNHDGEEFIVLQWDFRDSGDSPQDNEAMNFSHIEDFQD